MNHVRLRSPNGAPRPGVSSGAVAVSSQHDPRDPWLAVAAAGLMRAPLAGEPGHGCTAVLRRQPVLIVDGRAERGYTDAFELICCECGDNPDLDYSRVSPRLQQIRGPYTVATGLAAYAQHLGLSTADSPA